ncbi:MAG: hypothetical protein ABW076_09405 [Candidatus Thiodiazotropha sp.]
MRLDDLRWMIVIFTLVYGVSVSLYADVSGNLSSSQGQSQPVKISDIYREFMGNSLGGRNGSDLNSDDEARQAVEQLVSKTGEQKIDYIVVPVQENGQYFDKISRFMSAQWVAQALSRGLGENVMSPDTVANLFNAKDVIDADHIVELSKKTGSKAVFLLLDSEKYLEQKKSIKLMWILTDPSGNVIRRISRSIDDPVLETPLDLQVREISRGCLEELLDKKLSDRSDIKDRNPITDQFPNDLNDLSLLNASKISRAGFLQLLGFMTPIMFQHEREDYFQRSLRLLNEVDDRVEYQKVLSARAWFHLNRKPVSMRLLSDLDDAAARAALAYQNGNYTDLKYALSDIHNPLMRVLSLYEINELRIAYEKTDSYEGDLVGIGQKWKNFIGLMFRDSDPWFAPSNISYFSQIDGFFTEFDGEFKKAIEAAMVSGELKLSNDGGRIVEGVMTNGRRWKGAPGCCEDLDPDIQDADIWHVYSLIAKANVLRKLNKRVNLQGAYESAYEYAQKIEPMVNALPGFYRLFAESCEGLAKKRMGRERDFYLDKATQLVEEVRKRSVGMDTDLIKAAILQDKLYFEYNRKRNVNALNLHKIEHSEIPTSYVVFSKYALSAGSSVALPYVNSNFGVFKFTVFGEKWTDKKILDYLADHFDGNPDKIPYLAKRLESRGEYQEAIDLLSKEIETSGGGWEAYFNLGKLQIMDSRYADAKTTFLKFPGFKSTRFENPVALSGDAYSAGSLLYWLGRVEEFKDLYQICVDLATGAANEYASRQRLAMVDRDFETAIDNAYRRGARYNSRYGYRDFLAMLHLLGEHAQADAGFSTLVGRYQEPPIWTAQLIGRRIQGLEYSDAAKIAHEHYENAVSDNQRKQAIRYLFLETVTDRIPTTTEYNDFPDVPLVRESKIRGASTRLQNLITEIRHEDPEHCTSSPAACSDANSPLIDSKANLYKSHLLAYMKLKHEDYPAAYQLYLQIDKLSPLISYTYKYDKDSLSAKKTEISSFLPYFVEAATQVHADSLLRKIAETLIKEPVVVESKFDVDMSLALIHGYFGESDVSFRHLRRAFNERPHTKWRPLYSWYQLTEISEWMYQRYGDKRYLDLALDWSRRYQVIQPQFAWAYAFEAKYATLPEDRLKAAAFAVYLDRDSEWLKSVPEATLKQSAEWWRNNNPFVIRQDVEPEEKSASGPTQEWSGRLIRETGSASAHGASLRMVAGL